MEIQYLDVSTVKLVNETIKWELHVAQKIHK